MIDQFEVAKTSQRLMESKMRILSSYGFFGILLNHLRYNLTNDLETAATNGERIFFNPQFVSSLSNEELDFLVMHEVMHVALKHLFREDVRDKEVFNVACDIVVNSNLLKMVGNPSKKGLGYIMNLAPNNKDGYLYTAEEVYDMLIDGSYKRFGRRANDKGIDSHDKWDDSVKDAKRLSQDWEVNVKKACQMAIRHGCPLGMSEFLERVLERFAPAKIDWRALLHAFVQEDATDYSFSPPDRRYDGDFFLPDFNERTEKPGNVLFMIDTSASMNDAVVSMVYNEVRGAVEQFQTLKGWLGFFQSDVIPPKPFETVEDVLAIKPVGTGGTSFYSVLKYVANYMKEPPSCLVILTDGGASFPPEDMAVCPVLWVITTDEKPPWGKVAYIK